MAPDASSPTPHVAVVAFPFSSHAAVLLAFARALAAAAAPAGGTLSFLSTAASIAQLRRAVGAELPGNLRFVEVSDGAGPPAAKGAVPVPMPRQMELFMAATEASGVKAGLQAARAAAGGAKVSCVVGDAFVWPAAVVPPPSSLLPPLCRRTPPHNGGHGMAEVAAARRPLLPPSSLRRTELVPSPSSRALLHNPHAVAAASPAGASARLASPPSSDAASSEQAPPSSGAASFEQRRQAAAEP